MVDAARMAAGSGMMREPDKMVAITKAIVEAPRKAIRRHAEKGDCHVKDITIENTSE